LLDTLSDYYAHWVTFVTDIKSMLLKTINKVISPLGLNLKKTVNSVLDEPRFFDLSKEDRKLINQVRPYTMTSEERMIQLIRGVQYIISNKIEGDFVECGVWKGGSSMLIALTLQNMNVNDRKIWMYDTYEGMSDPTVEDKHFDGSDAQKLLNETNRLEDQIWCYSTFEEVEENIKSTKYPSHLIKMIKGKVEDTIPENLPLKISLLRLDTDFYESTKHELNHLYPILSKFGVLFIDDYGHWQGARQATDEFINDLGHPLFLSRVDYTARLTIKY